MITLNLNAEAKRFIDRQVKSGRYKSADDVLKDALQRLMLESEVALDNDTRAAIERAEAQFARGEWIDLATLTSKWRKKLGVR